MRGRSASNSIRRWPRLGDALDDVESGPRDLKSVYKYRTAITKVRSEAIASGASSLPTVTRC
jgi:hypothetical protein